MMIDYTDRCNFLGASDCAAVLGLSRWSTPLSKWAEKTGITPPKEMTDAMKAGIKLESVVAEWFTEETGKKVRVDSRDFSHPDYPFICCHIDRWVIGGELLECKTASAYKLKEWETDEIPQEYALQVNLMLGLLGMKKAYLAVLVGGQNFKWSEMEFDQDLYDEQIKKMVHFWNEFVLKNIPPMAMEGDKDLLLELHPETQTGLIKEEDSEMDNLILNIKEREKEIKILMQSLEADKNLLRQRIGDFEGIDTGKSIATWRVQSKTSIDTKAMKADGIYDKYKRTGSTRVLRTKIIREKS